MYGSNRQGWEFSIFIHQKIKRLLFLEISKEAIKMIKITTEQSFDFYLSSLERCGIHLLKISDKEIEYEIFEEFTTEYPASLSEYTLNVLEENGIIDKNIAILSKNLQDKLLKLNGSSLWTTNALKATTEWKETLQLSDEIKELIHQKWSDEELEYLRGYK